MLLLSQAAYGRRIGKSRQWVNKLVKQGVISLEGKKINPDVADREIEEHQDPTRDPQREANERQRNNGLFEESVLPEKSLGNMTEDERRVYNEKLKKERAELEDVRAKAKEAGIPTGDIEGGDKAPSLNKVKILKELYQGKLAKLDFEKKSELLLDREEVAEDGFMAGRLLRDKILNIPHKLSVRIVGIKSAKEVEDMMYDELVGVLKEVTEVIDEATSN